MPFGRSPTGTVATTSLSRTEMMETLSSAIFLPCADTVPMLLWVLLASGQIQMRKVDGWESLSQPLEPMPLDLAA